MKLSGYLKPFEYLSSTSFKLLALGQAVILLVVWFALPSVILPSPLEIAAKWHELASQQGMLVELGRSSLTIINALLLSSLITGTLTFIFTVSIFKPVIGWSTALRFLGFSGITFLFTLWTSDGYELKLWLLTFGLTVFQLTNSLAVVNAISQEEVDYARTLRLSGWRLPYELVFRGRMDEALDLVRQNAAIGWTLLSMVEGLVRSEGGIGSMLLTQSKHLHLSSIFAIQLTILAYGITQDYALRYLRELICPYVKLSSNGKK